MPEPTQQELIQQAASVIRSRKNGEYTVGNVGAAVLSAGGHVYTGVCIDTSSSMGFCAEHNAIGSMITEGESKIKSIVAVWKDENGKAFIVPPCGRCREFMRQIDKDNLDAEVLLADEKAVKLMELLPYYDSWEPTRVI